MVEYIKKNRDIFFVITIMAIITVSVCLALFFLTQEQKDYTAYCLKLAEKDTLLQQCMLYEYVEGGEQYDFIGDNICERAFSKQIQERCLQNNV